MRPLQPSTPQVSVPLRDGDRWLMEAIDGVLSQGERRLELIVVDDGSVDATPAQLRAAAVRDERVRLIRQPRLGLVAALNRGLAEARAPLIARLDADDVALYRWLDVEEPATDGPGAALIARAGELTDAERRLAARAPPTRMRSRVRSESGHARDLLLRLCRERPSTVLRAAWSLRV